MPYLLTYLAGVLLMYAAVYSRAKQLEQYFQATKNLSEDNAHRAVQLTATLFALGWPILLVQVVHWICRCIRAGWKRSSFKRRKRRVNQQAFAAMRAFLIDKTKPAPQFYEQYRFVPITEENFSLPQETIDAAVEHRNNVYLLVALWIYRCCEGADADAPTPKNRRWHKAVDFALRVAACCKCFGEFAIKEVAPAPPDACAFEVSHPLANPIPLIVADSAGLAALEPFASMPDEDARRAAIAFMVDTVNKNLEL